MTSIPKIVAHFETSLASKITSAAATADLVSVLDKAGNTISGYVGVTIDEGTATEEECLGTLAGSTLTFALRGLDPQDPTLAVAALKFQHRRGASVKITDAPILAIVKLLLDGTLTFPNKLLYATDLTFTDDKHLIAKKYADALAIAGAPDSSTTVKGIAKMSVAPALSTSPIAVGDNDPRLPTQGENDALVGKSGTPVGTANKFEDESDVSTVAAANKLVRALASGLIDPSFLSPNLIQALTAGPALTAGQAVAISQYQSDGGVLTDTSGSASSNSFAISVGANTNRGLLVFIATGNNPSTVSLVTYNGIAMTRVGSEQSQASGTCFDVYYLVAPATGSNTLAITVSAGTCNVAYFSLYNVAQTQPEASSVALVNNAAAPSTNTLNTIANGAVVFTASGFGSTTLSGTGSYITGPTPGGTLKTYHSGQVFPAATTITSVLATGGSSSGGFAMISIAPITAPALRVIPATSASSIVSQFQNGYLTFIGFANSSVSGGAAVNVTVDGVVTGLTLTPARQYYLNDSSGTIGLTAGSNSRKIGIALSATTLLLTNIW